MWYVFWNYRKCLLCCSIAIFLMMLTIHMEMGYHYEKKKMKHFVITICSVFLSHYIIFQHIGLFLLGLIWSSEHGRYFGNRSLIRGQFMIRWSKTPLDILKLQLSNLKAELLWSDEHRKERKNYLYLVVTKDLWLFLTNFILVLILVIYSLDVYTYFNTSVLTKVLTTRAFNEINPNYMKNVSLIYDYLNKTLIQVLNNGTDYNGRVIREPGWMDYQMNKLITIVRLRQSRFTRSIETGQLEYYFDCSHYLPGWRPFSHHLYYVRKYKPTYALWFCERLDKLPVWLLAQPHMGRIYGYWNPKAYKTYLHRDPNNSIAILNYMKQYRWIDEATAALFIDFALYNVDSDIFSICTIILEHTPFGSFVKTLKISSLKLQVDFADTSYEEWFLFFFYILLWIKIIKALVQNYWYEGNFWGNIWNYVDVCIAVSCVIIVVAILLRFYLLTNIMYKFERRNKLLFADFRTPAFIDYIVAIFKGVLITLTTIRIWKLLQFARVFRLFTRTLTIGASSFLWTLLSIFFLLIAVSLTAQILNGRHMESFCHFFGSMTTILSISFGFASRSQNDGLTSDHKFLSVLLHLFLLVGVAIILTNMFTTLVVVNFSNAYRLEEEKKLLHELKYSSFLWAQYIPYIRYISTTYKTMKQQRVHKLIASKLHEIDEMKRWKDMYENRKLKFKRRFHLEQKIEARQRKHEQRLARIERLGRILRMQVFMLERLVVLHVEQQNDSDVEENTRKKY